jgi:hypothetical protein
LNKECGRRGEKIAEDLVCFTLKLVFQDPKYGYDENRLDTFLSEYKSDRE